MCSVAYIHPSDISRLQLKIGSVVGNVLHVHVLLGAAKIIQNICDFVSFGINRSPLTVLFLFWLLWLFPRTM